MKKIIALILAVTMTIGLIPVMVGYTNEEKASVSVGQWLSIIDSEFGMTYYEQTEPYFEDIDKNNPYFGAVQTAVEWDVISADDDIDVYSLVEVDFMAATLAKAANLEGAVDEIKNADKLYNPDAVAIAVANGVVALRGGKLVNREITLAEGKDALAFAKNLWASRSFDNEQALVKVSENVCDLSDVLATEEGAPAYTVEKTDEGKEVVTLPAEAAKDVEVGDVIVLPASPENPFGTVKKVTDVTPAEDNKADDAEEPTVEVECEPAELEDIFEELDIEAEFTPDFQTAQVTDANGNVLNEADYSDAEGFSLKDADYAKVKADKVMMNLLRDDSASEAMQCAALAKKPININVALGDYAVKGVIDGNKMDFMVSAVIKGVKVTKTYNFTNFNLSTKADVDVVRAKIKEAYIRVDYDVVDSTKLEGNYNTTLANYDAGKQFTLGDFDTVAGTDILGTLQGAANSVATGINNLIPVANVEIPIPNMPLVSISLSIALRLNVDGSIELIIETNNARGYEIINNKGRVINNTINKQNTVNLGADCQLTANFNMGLKAVGIMVIDAGLETGIGVEANASITWFTAKAEPAETVTANVPLEIAVTLTEGNTYTNVTGDITIYGILNVSVGQGSSIMRTIGLAKTWEIFNKDNAVIYTYHFDEGNVPVLDTSEIENDGFNPETDAMEAEVIGNLSFRVGETASFAHLGTKWASTDSSVVAISADGELTAVGEGTARIAAFDEDGVPFAYEITVTAAPASVQNVVVVNAYQPAAAYAI